MNPEISKIKTLIVDDEPLARRTIRELLESDPEIEIIGECSNGLEAVKFIRKQAPDLLFLDIQMPGMSGLEALAKLEPERLPAIVFVTAFDKYALQAFEVHALDFLLKPFSDQRFEEALRQAKQQVGLRQMNELSQKLLALLRDQTKAEAQPEKFLRRFMIRSGARVTFIKATDVDWIEADDYYSKLHVSGRSHLLRISMNDLEAKLDPKRFLRIHRSTIINSGCIKELQQNVNGDYIAVLKNGTELKLSRGRRERLEELLMNAPD